VRPGSTLTPQPEIPAATRMVSAPADTASLIFLEYCVFILILPLLGCRERHYVSSRRVTAVSCSRNARYSDWGRFLLSVGITH
jgi:hypothetical protein